LDLKGSWGENHTHVLVLLFVDLVNWLLNNWLLDNNWLLNLHDWLLNDRLDLNALDLLCLLLVGQDLVDLLVVLESSDGKEVSSEESDPEEAGEA
jgi:hypothetical protein